MQVQVREDCNNCDIGVIYCDRWVRFFEELNAHLASFTRGTREYWKVFDEYTHQYQPHCPEEHPCPDCEGTTWLYRWVDLDELLASKLRPIYDLLSAGTP